MKIKRIEFAYEITDPYINNLDVLVENGNGYRYRSSLVHQSIYLTKCSKKKSISSYLVPQNYYQKIDRANS